MTQNGWCFRCHKTTNWTVTGDTRTCTCCGAVTEPRPPTNSGTGIAVTAPSFRNPRISWES